LGSPLTGQTIAVVYPLGAELYKYGTESQSCDLSSEYDFPVEEFNELVDVTARGVAVRYVNLGLVTMTVQVFGMFGQSAPVTLQLGNNNPPNNFNGMSYYGTRPPLATADGKSYLAFFYFTPFTDQTFQIKITVGASGGPWKIEEVHLIGEGTEISR